MPKPWCLTGLQAVCGKSELKDFKVVMFSGAENLTETIWHPLHETPALEHQRQFGNQVLFTGRVNVHLHPCPKPHRQG